MSASEWSGPTACQLRTCQSIMYQIHSQRQIAVFHEKISLPHSRIIVVDSRVIFDLNFQNSSALLCQQ